MAYKDLTFLLFAKDMSASTGFERVAGSADKMATGVSGSLALVGTAVAGLTIALTAKSVKMAADFQSATTRLVTDAGESRKALGTVSQGILDMSVSVGTSATDLAKGMYYVESAGYHGAAALQTMQAAAEGAKIGGADLTTVADALTTVMKDYGIQSDKANNTTSELIATVSRGKTTMEDLAGSLHSVLPNAQAVGISLNDVLGALATMTQEGISADQATQNLNHTIVSLASPTHVQATEMAAMGLNATTVAKQLGQKGLTGTLNELVTAITQHMGKGGLVLQNAFTNSALAAQSADAMFKKLPPTVQNLAREYQQGALTQKQWNTEIKNLSPLNTNLAKQWSTTENRAKGFADVLKSGSGDAQTFTSALAKMTGGQTGLQVALHITGLHASDTAKNVTEIGDAAKGTQKHVKDWSDTQGTFNQQMAEFQSEVSKIGIELGSGLLPVLGNVAVAMKNFIQFIDAVDNPMQHLDAFIDMTSGKLTPLGYAFGTVGHAVQQTITDFSDLGTIGTHVVDGLVAGIEGGVGKVHDAALSLAQAIPAPIRTFLGIFSPSRVAKQIGAYWGDGLASGITGSTGQVSSAATSLANTVKTSGSTAAINDVKTMTAQMNSLAKQRLSVTDKLAGLKQARTGVHDDTLSATLSAGDITSFGSAGDASRGLQQLVGKTKTFTADLKNLVGKGVSGTLLSQLVSGWQSDPDTALATAQSLLTNPTDLKQILSYQSQLDTAGRALGAYAGHAEYDSQVNAAAGKAKVLGWEMQAAARAGLKTVSRDLHINVTLAGHYAGTKDDLAKTIKTVVQDAIKKGVIPKNWATA